MLHQSMTASTTRRTGHAYNFSECVLLRRQKFWFACFVLTADADVDLHGIVDISISVAVSIYVVAAESECKCRCHGFGRLLRESIGFVLFLYISPTRHFFGHLLCG
jgi:hypothetical protein